MGMCSLLQSNCIIGAASARHWECHAVHNYLLTSNPYISQLWMLLLAPFSVSSNMDFFLVTLCILPIADKCVSLLEV